MEGPYQEGHPTDLVPLNWCAAGRTRTDNPAYVKSALYPN